MKKQTAVQVLFFLLLIALLYIVFLRANTQKGFQAQNEQIANLKSKLSSTEKHLQQITKSQHFYQDQSFVLAENELALQAIEHDGHHVDGFYQKVESYFLDQNHPQKDNPLIPLAGMEGVMTVNAIKLLNHKWVWVEFTDGVYWGEALYQYAIDQSNKLVVEHTTSFLYPKYKSE